MRHRVPFFWSLLIWFDLGLNPGLLGHWQNVWDIWLVGMFGFFVLCNMNLCGLFIHSKGIIVHIFSKVICPKMNVKAWFEFELTYLDVPVQYGNNDTTRIPRYHIWNIYIYIYIYLFRRTFSLSLSLSLSLSYIYIYIFKYIPYLE